MDPSKLRLVILAGHDSPATRLSVETLARLPQVAIAGILLDTRLPSFAARLRNLRRNLQREGWTYPFFRAGEFLQRLLDRLASRVASHADVQSLLRRAFPDAALSLEDLAGRSKIPIYHVGGLNDATAVEVLRRLRADLGVVLGTRILKRSTFSVPRLGCINLHKGKVPEYRGMPPGFWELYDRQPTAGVTVHFVDDGLDTGDVVGEETVSIHPRETSVTLRHKLDAAGSELLARCVVTLADGTAQPRRQPPGNHRAHTTPTRRQRIELDRRSGLADDHPLQRPFKSLYYLAVYYSGAFHLLRWWRRLRGANRACVLLYHRVNDQGEDELTVGVERFAEHALVFGKHYDVIPTSLLVERLARGEKLPANTLAIHFDDCYRDVYQKASAILEQVRLPACSFISSGYLDTDRQFAHDAEKYPGRYENLRRLEVVALRRRGFEIGAHTVNHVDLGRCSLDEASTEVVRVKADLEEVVQERLTLFSYPFGRKDNIRPEVVAVVRRAGYQALFSAYGGYVTARSSLYDIPRIGVGGNFRPLDLLMEIEGWSLGALWRWWKHGVR